MKRKLAIIIAVFLLLPIFGQMSINVMAHEMGESNICIDCAPTQAEGCESLLTSARLFWAKKTFAHMPATNCNCHFGNIPPLSQQ